MSVFNNNFGSNLFQQGTLLNYFLKLDLLGGITKRADEYGFKIISNIPTQNVSPYQAIMCMMIGQSNIVTNLITISDIDSDLTAYLDRVFVKNTGDSQFYSLQYRFDNTLDVHVSEAYYGLNMAKITKRTVYITKTAQGGTGFYERGAITNTWLVSDAELAATAVANHNAGKALITDSLYPNTYVIWNQGEADSLLQADADNYKQNVADLMAYIKSSIGGDLHITTFLINHWSNYIVSYYGNTTNNAKLDLFLRPNDALYIGGNVINVDGYLFLEDGLHYSTEDYKTMYAKTAETSLNILDNTFQNIITDNLCVNNGSSITMPASYMPFGAKSIWIKHNRAATEPTTKTILRCFKDSNNYIEIRFNANSGFPSIFYVNNGVSIVSGGGASRLGDLCTGFSWSGNVEDTLSLFNITIGSEFGALAKTPTASETVDLNTVVTTSSYTGHDIYGIYALPRVLTDDDKLKISQNREHEIDGIQFVPTNIGYGNTLYDNNGNACPSASAFTIKNTNPIPFTNLMSGRELHSNGSNFMIVPIGTIPISGFSKIENIDTTKWYHCVGSKLKFDEHNSLQQKDTLNILFDSEGIAQNVALTDLTADYFSVVSDDYKVNRLIIKN